jgi:hypothetical protein
MQPAPPGSCAHITTTKTKRNARHRVPPWRL